MFAKLKAKARAAFDNVVSKVARNLPAAAPVGIPESEVIPSEVLANPARLTMAQQLALAGLLKRPTFRGPTPRRERRAEKWARQDRSCSYGQGLTNHFQRGNA